MKRSGRARWVGGAALGVLAVLAGVSMRAVPSGAEEPVPGEAGTDTSLPLTDSAVTVRGTGPFEDLQITVNQTRGLGNQAVSITWSGGVPTKVAQVAFVEHFLQIMQCWTEPGATAPVPEQCVFGATDGVVGGGRNTPMFVPGFVDDRIVAQGDFDSFDPGEGVLDPATNFQWKPFRAVTGETVGVQWDPTFKPAVSGGDYWLNSFFNVITTNEIAGARTRPDGTGEELFEVATDLESSGLGCGKAVLATRGGAPEVPKCWLVIVPRGSAGAENEGTIPGESAFGDSPGVVTSPLRRAAWQHRIAIPLELNPLGTRCGLGADERRVVGSELLLRAMTSWQPVLCSTPGLPPYSYAGVGDASARLQLTSGASGAPGMAVTSRPLPPGRLGVDDPIVYAPLTVSGIVIGFNVQRMADPTVGSEAARLETARLDGTRVARLYLTPRLVAKLLTQSYRTQVTIASQLPLPADHAWAEGNPYQLDNDPDFLQFNPEFGLLRVQNGKNFGGLVLAAGTSDAARQVWEWILADPEARSWLDGNPDEWGMVVNPAYATSAGANSSGFPFGDPPPESFPKSDPYCYQAPPQGPRRVVPPLLCGADWFPYAESFRQAAQRTRQATDGARTVLDRDADAPERAWKSEVPQPLGTRAILSLVDSPNAAQYGLQAAWLTRAGDDGAVRTFMAPDAANMAIAVDAMVPSVDDPAVLVPDPAGQPVGAYPLTTLTYASVLPLSLDEQARADYAALVEYAVGAGQVPGLEIGKLPPGYAALPSRLVAQATQAAAAIRSLEPPPEVEEAPGAVPQDPATEAFPAVEVRSAVEVPVDAVGSEPSTPLAPISNVPVLTGGPDAGEQDQDQDPQVTPIASAGGARFAIPAVGIVALLSMLGALEITKRPRRAGGARPAATTMRVVVWGVTLALGAGLLGGATPAGAQEVDGSLDAGDLAILGSDGRRLDRGGSATKFTLKLSGAAECPGDSQNDNYRLYSFMVPIELAAEDVAFNGLGPIPRAFERYEDFRMPLHDVTTSDYAGGFTAEQDEPGGPGAIVDIPMLSFAVYQKGELPFGEYRVGLACRVFNETKKFWDTAIVVSPDRDDPAGFGWHVAGAGSPRGESRFSGPETAALGAGALFTFSFVLRLRRQRRGRSSTEAP